ncbi:MAG: calcium-binding protein, partial [Hyphomonadaceae bacterium]
MPTFTIDGGAIGQPGFDMTIWGAGDVLGVISSVFSSSHSPTHVTYTVSATEILTINGNFPTFDGNGDPSSGTAHSFQYTSNRFGAGAPLTITGTGFAIPVTSIINWAMTNNVAALQAAMFGGNDSITGTVGRDTLIGYDGNDTLLGGDGDDSLEGGAGNDLLEGGNGNDRFFDFNPGANTGVDTIDGGAGIDFIRLNATGVGVTLDMIQAATATGITLPNGTIIRNVEAVSFGGSSGDDTLILGGSGPAPLGVGYFGGAGVDALIADLSASTFDVSLHPGGPSLVGNFAGYTLESVERFQISTGSGADRLLGGTANDTLSAGGGNDEIEGGDGADTLSGGDGDDSIIGGSSFFATSNPGGDIIHGGAGNDTIRSAGAGSQLFGDAGDDVIFADASDIIDGGAGFDRLSISFANVTSPITVSVTAGGATISGAPLNMTGIEAFGQLTGGAGDDSYSLSGLTSGEYRFSGGEGYDSARVDMSLFTDNLFISGNFGGTFGPGFSYFIDFDVERLHIISGAGNDLISGSNGDDILEGGAGSDRFGNTLGADQLFGGSGDDVFDGMQAGQLIDGGAGNDEVRFGPSGGGVGMVFDTRAFDTALGGTFDGSIIRNVEIYTVFGTDGDDEFRFDRLTGSNFAIGIGGVDHVIVDLSAATGVVGVGSSSIGLDGAGLSLESIERLTVSSGAFADVMFGTAAIDTFNAGGGNDELDGGAGDDVLNGGAGDDELAGGDGNDQLIGGDGSDVLVGGAGNDAFNGGAGNDTAFFAHVSSGVSVDLALAGPQNTGEGMDTFTAVEAVIGSEFNDALSGNSAANLLSGFGGNDVLSGRGGNDDIDGGFGNDVLNGGDGNDTLFGDAGNDVLSGDAGNDILDGELGNDAMAGGAGNDTYFVDSAGDVVSEAASQGTDTVNASRTYTLTANV